MLSENLKKELVDRITASEKIDKILLFGSEARGDAGLESAPFAQPVGVARPHLHPICYSLVRPHLDRSHTGRLEIGVY